MLKTEPNSPPPLRLYKDRLAKLEEEERSLLADEPTHPEYLAMMRCLDERLDKKLEQSKREHEFQMAATARVDHAQRGQIWSQFFQEIRDARESALESLNQQWYDVQAARRSAHGSHTDQVLLYPKDPAQRTRNAMSYSAEVSALAAVAKHEGFPAAPAMRGATAAETDSDLEAIRVRLWSTASSHVSRRLTDAAVARHAPSPPQPPRPPRLPRSPPRAAATPRRAQQPPPPPPPADGGTTRARFIPGHDRPAQPGHGSGRGAVYPR
jgi:hypothetical protein